MQLIRTVVAAMTNTWTTVNQLETPVTATVEESAVPEVSNNAQTLATEDDLSSDDAASLAAWDEAGGARSFPRKFDKYIQTDVRYNAPNVGHYQELFATRKRTRGRNEAQASSERQDMMCCMLTSSKEAQTWGAGRVIVSDSDRRDIKKARKEGRLAEAMLDRRAALT